MSPVIQATFARQFLAQTFQNLSNLLTLLSSKSKCSVTRFVTTSIVFYYLMLSHCKAISIRNLARFHGKHSMQFTLKQPQGFREMRPIHLSNQGLCPKSFKISQQKVKKKYRILFKWPLFVYFRSFQPILQNKNFRLQRDSDSNRQGRRRAR